MEAKEKKVVSVTRSVDFKGYHVSKRLLDKGINIDNFGNMSRDFHYIDDLVSAIRLLIYAYPIISECSSEPCEIYDSKSHIVPFRTINIRNSKPEKVSCQC